MEWLSAVIMVLSVFLSGYVIAKMMARNIENLIETQKEYLTEDVNAWLQTENAQKLIYGVGVLIGNGAKQGLGLQSKGGKMKFEDLIMAGISTFIESKMSGSTQREQKSTEKNLYPSKY